MKVKNAINMLSIMLNPFSPRRKRPNNSRYVGYTRDVLKREDCEIGEYTYGIPLVIGHPGRKLRIGKFCSVASGVIVQLGGNHRVDLGTTYPF
jgi:hypothetical protein